MTRQSHDDSGRQFVVRTRRWRVGYMEDWPGQSFVVSTECGSMWLLDLHCGRAVRWPQEGDGEAFVLVTGDALAVGHPLTLLVRDGTGREVEIHGGDVTRIVVETFRGRAPK